jgi:hypothetical protein
MLTDITDGCFGERVALLTLADTLCRICQRITYSQRRIAITLEQMQRHALGGFRPHSGQAAQRFDKRL